MQMSKYLDVEQGGVEPTTGKLHSSIRSIPEIHAIVEIDILKKNTKSLSKWNPSSKKLSFP